MSEHRWGINWMRYHARGDVDFEHVRRMQYRAVTVYEWMWSDETFCNNLLAALPDDAIVVLRDHPLSEQKSDMYSHPLATGQRHADEWAAKRQGGKIHIPEERCIYLGINEPDSNHHGRAIDHYTMAYCNTLADHGMRAGAYSFGVGHPATVDLDPDKPIEWSLYERSAHWVLEGGHVAVLHEYGAPANYAWGFWCNRMKACPYPFDVIVGECGIDYGVVQRGNNVGWQNFLHPREYAAWLDGYHQEMERWRDEMEVNVLAYNIFCYDSNDDWKSFRVDGDDMRRQLEDYPWTQVEGEQEPDEPGIHTVYLPHVSGGEHVPSGEGIAEEEAPDPVPAQPSEPDPEPEIHDEPAPILGADVSIYQVRDWQGNYREIDFHKMRAAGVRYVFVRGSFGSTWIDDYWEQSVYDAVSAGLIVGMYPIVVAGHSVRGHIENIKRALRGRTPALLAPDVERQGIQPALLKGIMQGLKAEGLDRPSQNIIYTAQWWWGQRPQFYTDPYWRQFDGWFAAYIDRPLVPKPWTDYKFWQWTSSGDGPKYGVTNGNTIDLNWFNGSLRELVEYVGRDNVPAAFYKGA